ncbi:MAG: ATP-binding protein [Caulobacteraceae bacterium]
MSSSSPDHDPRRLIALHDLHILDVAAEESFDDLVQVAKVLAGAKIALISLVDAERLWFMAKAGIEFNEMPREDTFCAHAILEPGVLWVEDARLDERFADNPLVTGATSFRFYAGAPVTVQGQRVGTICVIDDEPHPFCAAVANALSALARTVSKLFLARKGERIAARLLGTTIDAIICFNERGVINYWNPAAEKTFGYSTDEAIGRSIREIVPDRLRESHSRGIRALIANGAAPSHSMEVVALHKGGHEFPIELSMALWRDGDSFTIGSILRDITARVEAERALSLAKDQAESATVAKSAFLANMSHEIRTPLNGVIAIADLLGASDLNTKQAEMAKLIQSSAKQLQHLLGDILDLARIEAGEVHLTTEPFAVADLGKSIVDVYALKGRERGLAVSLLVEPEADRYVCGDPVRIKQVLSNLVSNAIKFTQVGSVEVTIRLTTCARFEFKVTDTGVGFDPCIQEQLFNRFQQADGSITRRFGGSGLGLAICRELVGLMGGQISCSSQEGAGSSFSFTVPLELSRNGVSEAPDVQLNGEERPLSILVADDHPTNRLVIEMIMEGMGFKIVCVENGFEAVEAFKQQRFDVVLMDMMMPLMDGLTATRGIRDYEAAQGLVETPVLMLTANAFAEHIEASKQAGANQHIAKPITADQLMHGIFTALHEPSLEMTESA